MVANEAEATQDHVACGWSERQVDPATPRKWAPRNVGETHFHPYASRISRFSR